MNIVVPCSGRGQRFVEAGYKEPKPLIPINGIPMIAHVLENVAVSTNDQYYLINRHPTELHSCLHLRRFSPHFICTDKITQGAACTVLLAKDYINNNDELIIINSDQWAADFRWATYFVEYMRENDAGGGIVTFLASDPKWSFAKFEGDRIVEVAEKRPISQLATMGCYYFKKGSDFVRCAERMIHENFRVNGEFYTAPVFNYLIAEGGKVLPYMVNRMYGLGTPEDFEKNKDKIK